VFAGFFFYSLSESASTKVADANIGTAITQPATLSRPKETTQREARPTQAPIP
jgi:hypothetical protein